MGRSPCCSKEGLNRGAWTAIEDEILINYIKIHGEGRWRSLPIKAGLKRCGKSCRLRWLNYLRPDIKRGNISHEEEELIIRLHKLLGNRWSLIAGRLPGRTDNEIKNYWNTNLVKKLQKQPISKQPVEGSPAPELKSNVIRTKASRCTRVFISPPQRNVENLNKIQDVEATGVAGDFAASKGKGLESCRIPSLTCHDDDSSSSLVDLDMGEFCLELFNSDYFQVLGESSINDDNNAVVADASNCNQLLHPFMFSEEMLVDWTGGDCFQTDVGFNLESMTSCLDSQG